MYTQKAIRRPKTKNDEPSKTDQTFKDDADVNVVLRRFMKTGDQSIFRQGGSYSDVSEVPDLLEAHLQIQRAKEAFDLLPSDIRKKLKNNPLMLEQYLADPANHEEARDLGLLRARPQDEASKPAVGENISTTQLSGDNPRSSDRSLLQKAPQKTNLSESSEN